MAVIATLSGTALRPGISKNRRYYSPDLIERMVGRANERMADEGGRPLTMRVAHPDPETQQFAEVTKTVGRLTGLRIGEDGSARFTADLYDTSEGRDVLSLYDTRGQQPAVRNVSIRGRWLGDVVGLTVDGVQCEGADDLELDGLDFTHLPGVDGAQVDRVAAPGAALEAAGAVGGLIFEALEESFVTVTEEVAPAQTAPHADLGYLADGQRRWPLGTLAEARESWIAIQESKNAERYTAGQIKRLRGRTAKALRGFGVEVRRDLGEAAGPVLVSRGQVAEGFGGDWVSPGEFFVCLDNGTVSVRVSSCQVDPHDLGRVGTQAMAGAVAALLAMDPDDDGDIDVAGAGNEAAPIVTVLPLEASPSKALPAAGDDDDEDDTEAAPAATETAAGTPPAVEQTPASSEDAANTTESEAPVMTDATQAAAAEATPATPTTPAPAAAAPLTIEALTAFGTAMGEALAAKLAPAAPAAVPAAVAAPAAAAATEADPAVAETEDQRIARLVDERFAARNATLEAEHKAFLQTEVAAGRVQPVRKGIVGKVTESGELQQVGDNVAEGLNEHGLPTKWAGSKAPHELTGAGRASMSAALLEHYVGSRIPR